MRKTAMVFASLSGFIAVILGAIGTHAINRAVDMNLITPNVSHHFDTAVYFQLFHSILIIGIIALQFKFPMYFNPIMYLFMAGIILFSGSIYLLVFGEYFHYTTTWAGPLTPVGGVCLIAGWFLLYLSAAKYRVAK